tara:strand:+ start:963 stop:1262 length:300 start_codon:yes stop_codon:yes gene_type:complete
MTNRYELLNLAHEAIKDRGEDYGTIHETHERIAIMWTVLLGREVSPEEVVMCMIAVKMARLAQSPGHLDSWVDIAGYAACGAEVLDGGQKDIVDFTDDG